MHSDETIGMLIQKSKKVSGNYYFFISSGNTFQLLISLQKRPKQRKKSTILYTHNKIEIHNKMASTVCKNESCQLGCICESIQGTSIQKKRNEWGVLRIKPDHCNKLVCMFDCVCHLPKEKKQREKKQLEKKREEGPPLHLHK